MMGVLGRWGWNEGRHESFAYTEVDETAEIGAGGNGKRWHRKFDRAGVAFVSNGISGDHQEYLALGDSGFLLGDGPLISGARTSSKRITRSMVDGEFILRSAYSTSTIPDTTETADR